MTKRKTGSSKARLELDAIRRIYEADLEHDRYRRDMDRRWDDLNARYQRLMDEKLADWAAEDAEFEASLSEIRPPVPAPASGDGEQITEPDLNGLSYDDYVIKVRPGLDIASLGQGGLFW